VLELRAGDAEAVVDPDGGGRLTRLAVGAFDLLSAEGCFVMAPWAGRTGRGRFAFRGDTHELPVPPEHAPHAIHGTVRNRVWTVTTADERHARLRIDLGAEWPWAGTCEQIVTLEPGAITLVLSVHSDGDEFPALVGWHPWFTKPLGSDVEADALLERGDDHLPTGARLTAPDPDDGPLDDCYEGVHWPVALHWPDLTLQIDATGCPFAVVYSEPEHATCVEPQTGPPNGLATGEYAVVSPTQPLVASTTWRWGPARRT